MARDGDHLDRVCEIVEALRGIGFEPILVGGMALVVLGSRRVTRDFDFVVGRHPEQLRALVRVFYDRGLALASRLDRQGNVTTTIDNPKVAEIRLRIDAPVSAFFVDSKTALRIDLLFDFPVPATDLARKATQKTVRAHSLTIASRTDLLRLKRIAAKHRKVAGDADDIRFLESRGSRDG
jgi:hypothetical protein